MGVAAFSSEGVRQNGGRRDFCLAGFVTVSVANRHNRAEQWIVTSRSVPQQTRKFCALRNRNARLPFSQIGQDKRISPEPSRRERIRAHQKSNRRDRLPLNDFLFVETGEPRC